MILGKSVILKKLFTYVDIDSKRARYDSGEDLMDPMEGFGGGMGGGGMNIDPGA